MPNLAGYFYNQMAAAADMSLVLMAASTALGARMLRVALAGRLLP